MQNPRDASQSSLWDALVTVTARFDKVLITVDALDECRKRRAFPSLIQRIFSSVDNVGLLVTSRNKVDIGRAMGKICTRTSLSEPIHPLLASDISEYIQKQLSSDAFESWDKDLRSKVEQNDEQIERNACTSASLCPTSV